MPFCPSTLRRVVFALLTPLAFAGGVQAKCESHAAYALLIGIDDYEISGERNLEGPVNDVALMKGVLKRKFEIPEKNITTITDTEATHTGIAAAFKDLAARATDCDFVYIHYSGHGAQLDNEDKATKCDTEELDQTWVSYGARSNAYSGTEDRNNADVLDDEINQWLSMLETENYVFVSDSCHSGTVFRGEVDGVRSASPYPGRHPLAKAALRCAEDPRGIKIGAARDIEEAIEIKPRLDNAERKVYGRLTWYWAKALEKALPSETWSDVFDRAYALVVTDEGSRKQYPQITGNADRAIFGGAFREPAQTVQILDVGEDGRTVTLAAGAVANMTEGSELKLFRRGEHSQQDLPRLKVAKVLATTSIGEVLQGRFEKGDAVIETRHAYAFEPYRLFVDPTCGGVQVDLSARDQDRPLFDELLSTLDALEGFAMAEADDSADMIVCVLRPRKVDGGDLKTAPDAPLPQYFDDADPEVWIVDQGLEPIHPRLRLSLHDPQQGVRKLAENLTAYLRGQEVIRFGLDERPGKRPEIGLSITLLREAPASTCTESNPCRELPLEGLQDKRYRFVSQVSLSELANLRPQKDDILEFRVQNKSNTNLYAYVLNISKNLAVSVIYPSPDLGARQEYANVEPGEERVLDYAMWQVESGDDDWFKLIASKSPVDVNVFVRSGLAEYRASRSLQSPPSALEEILGAALHTRGRLKPTVVEKWFVEQNKLETE